MKKHLFFLCMTFLSSTFVFAQSYTQNFGTGNGDGRSWDNTVFQTATDGTKTVTVNFDTKKLPMTFSAMLWLPKRTKYLSLKAKHSA